MAAGDTTPGRRRDNTPLSDLPDELLPGDYWRVTNSDSEPLTIEGEPTNLTGGWWYVIDPFGGHGNLMKHTVREHEDGTITVAPNDGSSNSILITQPRSDGDVVWHGYIEAGVWREI